MQLKKKKSATGPPARTHFTDSPKVNLVPWRRRVVVIVSAKEAEDRGFVSRQGARF
jgi:hypothetical protein